MAKKDKAEEIDSRLSTEATDFTNSVEAPKGWEDEQTGFPPYWNPLHVGNSFRGIVTGYDDKDENFPRYVLRATVPLICAQGPAEDAEKVNVAVGESFSTSVYVALPLHKYLGEEVYVIVKNFRVGVGQGDGIWQFRLLISPDARKRVRDRELAAASANPLMNPGEA